MGKSEQGENPFTWDEALHQLRDVYNRYSPGRETQIETTTQTGGGVWAKALDAPTFLAQPIIKIQGLAKDLIVPGQITLIASPRGIGKTLVGHAVAVAMATGGKFRGEAQNPLRVLLVDRENSVHVINSRLRSWGAENAPNLKILTREDDPPDLKNKAAWNIFPTQDYDVIIIDSLLTFTEGVTEKEGKETSLILGTLLDLKAKGPAILLLANCTKDALFVKGRGDWMDRVDIVYEVRDATDFTPSGTMDWWLELPKGGEKEWADRASRRKGRIDYRLAFVTSKFRGGAWPDPFCLEVRLPEDQLWTLEDVTQMLLSEPKDIAVKKIEEEITAVLSLADAVREHYATAGKPMLITKAASYLQTMRIHRDRARKLIEEDKGYFWILKKVGGKGNATGLFPVESGKLSENMRTGLYKRNKNYPKSEEIDHPGE